MFTGSPSESQRLRWFEDVQRREGKGLRWSCREEEGVKEDMKRAGETEEDAGIAKGEELKFYNRML